MGDAVVKLAIEFGDIEIEFEGPAEFAKNDLLDVVGGLIDRLASLEVGGDFDEDEMDEDDEDDAQATGGRLPSDA